MNNTQTIIYPDTAATWGENIQLERKFKGFTRKELAYTTGVKKEQIKNMEAGKPDAFLDINAVNRVCNVLGLFGISDYIHDHLEEKITDASSLANIRKRQCENLKIQRRYAGISRKELAYAAGITKKEIKALENGKTSAHKKPNVWENTCYLLGLYGKETDEPCVHLFEKKPVSKEDFLVYAMIQTLGQYIGTDKFNQEQPDGTVHLKELFDNMIKTITDEMPIKLQEQLKKEMEGI